MAEEKETKNPVQSAERIFQVMEMLAENGEMGLMEISAALGLHKSTVHRLLMSLIYMGYAIQDETTQIYPFVQNCKYGWENFEPHGYFAGCKALYGAAF